MNTNRLIVLRTRLLFVRGNLPMNGLITHRGKAPLSPLGYALGIDEFRTAGLWYKSSFNEEMNVPYSALRFPKPDGGNYHGFQAAAAFFDCALPIAHDMFTASSYPSAWDGGRSGAVPVGDIIARLQSYIEE